MAYNIPYDSGYGSWYGAPINVTNLVATLTQVAHGDSVTGRIDARWDMPDNGGTFKVLLSTDGTNFYFEKRVDTNYTTLEVEAGTDYYIRIITVLGVSESSGTTSNIMEDGSDDIPSDTSTPGTPTNLALDTGTLVASWSAVPNTNIKYYELRTDTNTGSTTNLIAQINATSVPTHLTARSGTLYLYAVNTLGNYSEPATLQYSKAISTPADPTLTPYPCVLRVDVGTIPAGCTVDVLIDNEILYNTSNRYLTIACQAGQHFVAIAYRDGFGAGSYSNTVSAIVPAVNTTNRPYPDFDEQDRLIIVYPESGSIVLVDHVLTIPESGATLEMELQRTNLPHKILHIQ